MTDEVFSIPGAGAIIQKIVNNKRYILVQERFKDGCDNENGLLEIPAGKIRANENIYECLKREIWEETGYKTKKILGETESETILINGYSVLTYEPFSSSQNIANGYPILVQVFLCEIEDDDEIHSSSNESKNIHWIEVNELKEKLLSKELFYPMHIKTLEKYCKKVELGEI
jgi:ADP-ribose pyrophosphatase/8-oxo-dGTP diphosphatase